MKTKLFSIGLLAFTMVISCNEKKQEETIATESVETKTNNDIIKNDSVSIEFDNQKEVAIISFNGEKVELPRQKSASGIWYKNESYDLSGKGNDIVLKKKDKVIYEHFDDIVNVEAKNEKGDILRMTFNNTEGTIKAYLNGGEQIDLKQKKSASGIWYANDDYELSGKGDKYQLKKGKDVVFEN